MGPLHHLGEDTGRRTNNKFCKGKEKEEVDWMETKDRRANIGIQEKGDGKER